MLTAMVRGEKMNKSPYRNRSDGREIALRSAILVVLSAGAVFSTSANADSVGGPQIETTSLYNWLLNVASATPTGTQLTQFVALGGQFSPNPSPSNWLSPPSYQYDYLPFGLSTTVTASKSGVASIQRIPYLQAQAEPTSYYSEVPFKSNYVGAWNLHVSTTSAPGPGQPSYPAADFTTNDTTGIPFLNPASNVSVSSLSPKATVSWSFGAQPPIPSGMSLGTRISIVDSTGDEIDFFSFPELLTSLNLGALPPTNSDPSNTPSKELEAGKTYTIYIDAGLSGPTAQYSESQKFFSFTPSTSAKPGSILLPSVVVSGGTISYAFDTTVIGGQTYNFDPAWAQGFIYRTGAGDPNFASVELPDIGNLNDYSLYLWEQGKWVFDTSLGPDTVFDFASGGVGEFEILSINPAIDASNGNEFVTQLSFVKDGEFTGSMTAVVPEPSTWVMALIGFFGLAFTGYRRRHAGLPAYWRPWGNELRRKTRRFLMQREWGGRIDPVDGVALKVAAIFTPPRKSAP
jgi:hypothetical protein